MTPTKTGNFNERKKLNTYKSALISALFLFINSSYAGALDNIVSKASEKGKSKRNVASFGETPLGSHSIGLGLGQTFLTGDFGKNGEDSITVDVYYKYKASYSFDLIVNGHYSEHDFDDKSSSLVSLNAGIKARLYNFDSFNPYLLGGLGFYLPSLKRKIDKHTVLVAVCHIDSQCGNILDVEKLGKFIKKINTKIIFLIDACQSAGHLKLNVKKNMCDALVCSGRKYLRGPRGTGLIFIKDSIQKKIIPKIIDTTKSKIIGRNLSIINSTNIFETFEYSPSLKIGLSKAIEKYNKLGHKEVEFKIKNLSKYFRKKISSNPLVTIYENESLISGINTFSIKGNCWLNVITFLVSHGVKGMADKSFG